MKITKKQIVALDKQETTVRELFPEVFETKLEVGKWYKGVFTADENCLIFIENTNQYNNIKSYGFNHSGYFDDRNSNRHYGSISDTQDWIPATKKEVETALINELIKLGFKKGANVKSLGCFDGKLSGENCLGNTIFHFDFEANTIYANKNKSENIVLFENGKFAEIIQPKQMTKEEIEKELGYEIEIKL